MLKKSMLVAIVVSVILVIVSVNQINAFPAQQITQKINCNDANSTPEINYCAGESYKAADRRLNQVYQQLTATVSGEQKRKLIAAQQTWIEFRDRNCSFETYGSRDGTGYSAFLSGCLERITKQRTADFERFMRER